MPSSKEVKLYKQPTKKTITIGSKKRSNKDFIKKLNIKDKIENYYPKLIYLNKKELNRYLNRIKKNIKVEEKFGQEKLIKNKSYIYHYKNIGRFYEQKSNTLKILAITDKPHNPQELLDLTENLEKDLIDFGNEEEKDLIDFDTIIPNKKPTAQELLMDEELFPKGKKYKLLQNEDLIPITTNPSTNGVNILKNILNYPETKRLLGISLTSDLKEKIKNLDSEASFGMASILSSLLTANRGKMSIYSISRNQLKEIIEGFITTLSVLLNPAQKY